MVKGAAAKNISVLPIVVLLIRPYPSPGLVQACSGGGGGGQAQNSPIVVPGTVMVHLPHSNATFMTWPVGRFPGLPIFEPFKHV